MDRKSFCLSLYLTFHLHKTLAPFQICEITTVNIRLFIVWSLWQRSRRRSRHRSTPLYNLQSASSIINTSLRDYPYAELSHLLVSIRQNAF